MSLRLTNIRLPVEEAEDALPAAIRGRLTVDDADVVRWRILKKSLDARSRFDLEFVYSVVVDVRDEAGRREQLAKLPNVDVYEPAAFFDPPAGKTPLDERPVVVGSGPAGLLAGYYLASRGYRPLILERGQPVKERVRAVRAFDRGGELDRENNYLFGEGGAGCFSDGKLTCRISGPDVDWVLERFVECGGRESLTWENRPHLGSNKLPLICRNFRRRIEAMGGEYRFGCRMEGLNAADGRIRGVATSSGYLATGHVVLAVGHSARDVYRSCWELGVPMEAKAFQLGLRIEQPQDVVNRASYGRREYLDILGAADYALVAKGTPDLYTFCMCAGGVVIPSISEPKMFASNGMSNSRHDTPFANSGLVVTLDPRNFSGDHALAGVELQAKYESAAFRLAGGDYSCPISFADDFLAGRAPDAGATPPSSYERGVRPVDLSEVIPPTVVNAIRAGLPVMDRKWRGSFLKGAVLVGPEMRGSSPVRISRDHATRETPGFAGLYPVGEGAGYAGGIVTAAVDGLRSARKIVETFAPLET